MSFLVALLILPLVPLLTVLSRRITSTIGFLLLVGAVGAGYASLQSPSFTHDSPQQINLTYFEAASRNDAQIALSSWEGEIPPSLTGNLKPLPDATKMPYPLGSSIFLVPRAQLSSPQLELLKWDNSEQSHSARIRLRPTINSQEIQIRIAQSEELSRITALGLEIPLPEPDPDGQQSLLLRGVPDDGLEMTLTWQSQPSLSLSLIGITPNLPPHLKSLSATRGQVPGCPAHVGDRSITLRRITLKSPLF